MAKFTENYGLEKPAQNEFYNVDVQNQNMDKIDQAIAEAGNNPQLEIDVAEIKDKIGSPNDAGSSSTTSTTVSIFAKLNYLVSQVSSYLSNIYSRIGGQNDTASSSTSSSAHAKLNWFLNLFGKTDDTGGTMTAGTVMGKLNRIVHDVNTGEITIDQKKLSPAFFRDNGNVARVGISRSFYNLKIDKIEGDYIFAQGGVNRTGKLKIDKNSLEVISDENDAYYGDYIPSYCDDVDYTYGFSVGSFYKHSRVDGTLVGTAAYVPNCSGTSYASMDEEYVYVSTMVSDVPKVLKYKKDTLVLTNTYTVDIQGAIFVEAQNIYIISAADSTVLNAYSKVLVKKGAIAATFESNNAAKKVLHVYENNGYIRVAYHPYFTNKFYVGKFNISTLERVDYFSAYPGAGQPNDTNNLKRMYVSSPVCCYENKVALIDLYSMKIFVFDLDALRFGFSGDLIASTWVTEDKNYTLREPSTNTMQNFTARNLLFDGENIYCVVTLMMPYYNDITTNLTSIENRIFHFKLSNGAVYKNKEYQEVN